jgi:hypothetical protein
VAEVYADALSDIFDDEHDDSSQCSGENAYKEGPCTSSNKVHETACSDSASKESESEGRKGGVDHVPGDSVWNKVEHTPIHEPFIGQMGVNRESKRLDSIFEEVGLYTDNCKYDKQIKSLSQTKF